MSANFTDRTPPTATAIRDWLVARLSELLEVEPGAIDVRTPFADYGLGSVHAVSLSGQLEDWLGHPLAPTLLYDFPNLQALADHLGQASSAAAPAPLHDPVGAEPIAIIGIGCRLPGAADPQAFWRLLRDGVDAIAEVPPDRWSQQAFYDPNPVVPGKINTRWGGFLEQVDQFDPQFFGISPREAASMDPQQRLLLEVAWEALEDAGQAADQLAGSPTGVFIGISSSDYSRLQFDDPAAIDAYAGTGNAHSIAANRLSYLLDLRGPSIAVDTACSSSLVAVHLACQSLRNGECSMAVAGGVNMILFPDLSIAFSQARMLAPDGRCKTFDAGADGYVRSEGCGVVVLKPLSRALRDRDPILALVRGSAVNQDGRSNGLTAPNGLAQEAVIRQALHNAGIAPAQVSYFETHGTGTSLGDPIEFRALKTVLMQDRAADQPCALGSLKTNIGHLEAAAGIAGLIKVVLSLRAELIPPHLHLNTLNPYIGLAGTPLVIPTALQPWPAGGARRFAGVSSFGFGGTNAHVIVEEAPALRPATPDVGGPHLLAISAKSEPALRALVERYRSFLASDPAADGATLHDICYTAALRRSHYQHRLALVAHTREEAAESLGQFARGEADSGRSSGHTPPGWHAGVVFVFSGQGPQWWAMGRELLEQEPVFRSALEECDRLIGRFSDWSLLEELRADESRSRLDETAIAQPAIFAIQVALAVLWQHWGVMPAVVVGHSVGEVAAAYIAGALSLADAVRVIFHRGRVMQRAQGRGKMAQVELPVAAAQQAIADYADRLSIAAINSPATTVLSGEPESLDAVLARLREQGVACRELRGSYAFHSVYMEPLQQELEQALRGLRPRTASRSIISTVSGQIIDGRELDRTYWRQQIREPVRFAAAIDQLIEMGYHTFVEIGPHPVLSAAIDQCLRGQGQHGTLLASLRRGAPERATLLRSLGALYVEGCSIGWQQVYPDGGQCVGLPAYPWQRERCWLDVHSQVPAIDRAHVTSWEDTGRHPLLGRQLTLAHRPEERIWENILSRQHPAYLEDHRFQGAIVLPAAAYLEMALAVATEVSGQSSCALTDIAFSSPLLVSEHASRTVQFVLDTAGGQTASFRVFSRPAGAERDAAWTQHASGKLQPGSHGGDMLLPGRADIKAIRRRCRQSIAAGEHYLAFKQRGLEYGARFQGVTQVWRGVGEALGLVYVPEALEPELAAYQFHPAILDACAQVLGAIDDDKRPFLPVHADAVRFYGRPERQIWSHARLTESTRTANGLAGDVWLLDEAGNVLVEAQGLQIRYVESSMQPAAQARPEQWLYQLEWHLSEHAPGRSNGPAGSWLIFADAEGVAEQLAALLAERGDRCVLVAPGDAYEQVSQDRIRIRPAQLDHVRRLFADVLMGQPACRGVIHLWSLDAPPAEATTVVGLEAVRQRGSETVVQIVQQLAHMNGRVVPRLWLVTRGAQLVEQASAHLAIAQSSVWGLGRTIAQEQPGSWGGAIDLEPGANPRDDAALILQELHDSDRENLLAFRGGRRYVARLVRRRGALDRTPAPCWRNDASYLITGGLGGLGMLVARWMVEQGARRVILLGRAQLPPRTEWSRLEPGSRQFQQIAGIRRLEALGASVQLASVDVSDEGQLATFLETFRSEGWPPIRGVVHAAGVLQDRVLLQLDSAMLSEVFRAKVIGSWLLHRLLGDEPLDFFVLFSSAAALLGSAGQGNYAAANAFLDALAHERHLQGKPGLSINWGPWAEAGMAAHTQAEHLTTHGIGHIPPEHGLELFGRLLGAQMAQVGVMAMDWAQLFQSYAALRDLPLFGVLADEEGAASREQAHAQAGRARAMIHAAEPEQRHELIVALLREQVARIVGLAPSRVDVQRPLNTLGIDSLMSIELKNKVELELGVAVPVIRLLESPSIAEFASVLLEQLAVPATIADPDQKAPPARPVALPRPPVVEVQPAGSRLPFFCIHPGALNQQCYAGLARRLGNDQPFYVIQPVEIDNYHALSGELIADIPFEEIALRCLESLQHIQPEGPYLLGGWSMGGVLAFEMARQLQQQGKPVAFLALFDSPAPPDGERPVDYDDAGLLPAFSSYLGARRGVALARPAGDVRERDSDALFKQVLEQAKLAGILPPSTPVAQLRSLLHAYKHGLRNAVQQLWDYTPGVYPGDITYFRAGEPLEAYDALFPNPTVAWSRFAAKSLAIYTVPGDHYTMFLDPHANVLAEQLSRCLDLSRVAQLTV